MTNNVENMRELIAAVLTPGSRAHVEAYFAPDSHYAGATFNTVGTNAPYAFGPDDLLAVHLLGMKFDPLAARQLLEPERSEYREAERLLHHIDADVPLWDDKAAPLIEPAAALWSLLDSLHQVGPVTAGKLLARKRPHLVPILDEVVRSYLNSPKGGFWELLRKALRDSDLPERIEGDLRPDSLASEVMREHVSTLRLLDVAIWMQERDRVRDTHRTTGSRQTASEPAARREE